MKTSSPFRYTTQAAKKSDQEFEQLKKKWYDQLKAKGFNDIEKPTGELYQPELRTIAWANRDVIREFFLKLDEYLNKHRHEMPVKDQVIMDLFSKGLKLKDICALVKPCRTRVCAIIRYYKHLVLTEYHF